MQEYFSLLTATGANLLINAVANKTPVKLSKIAVSDSEIAPSKAATELENTKHEFAINSLTQDPQNSSILNVEGVIPSNVGGFNIRKFAIFTQSGEMFAVGRVPLSYKPALNQGAGSDVVFKIRILVGNVSNIELKVDNSIVLATRDWTSSNFLGKTEKATDSDKLDGLDSSAFARIEHALVKRGLPKGDYRSVGFWRTVEAGWYSYNHDSIQGSNNPSAYGVIHIIKDGDDYNILWYRKGAAEIYRAGFGGSQAGNSTIGWSIVAAALTTGNYPNTAVMRTENGDFSGRYIEAGHFKMLDPNEDYLFTPPIEIIYRQTDQNGQHWLRGVSADKFREVLKLFRLDKRNATSVYTASQANPTIDLSRADNFEITLTGSGVLTLNNGIKGQSGVITISNAATNITGYASNIKWRTTPTSLQATETFAYFVWHDGYISIGRV